MIRPKHFRKTSTAENRQRSLIKSITWRILGSLDTIIISYFITRRVTLALSIGGIELITKMLLYYFHERSWEHIEWGKS